MKRKIAIAGMTCLMLTVIVLPFIAPPAESAAPKKYEWKFFVPGTPTVPFSPLNVQMCDKIRERTKGRLDIKVYFYGELPYKNADVLTVVQDRKVEVGSCFDGHAEGVQDWYGLIYMPTIFSGRAEALKMNDEVIMPFMDKTLRKNIGVIPLCRCVWNANDIFSRKKLTSLSDIKGQKLRCASAIQEVLVKELGGIPFYVDQPEVYTALQRGTIDGAITGATWARGGKWFEVIKWLYIWDFTQAGEGIYVNEAAFNELPKDIKDIVVATAKEINDIKLSKAVELDRGAIEEAEKVYKRTVTHISASDHAKALKLGDKIIDDWLKAPKRSDDAKRLYDLILKAKKK